MDDSFQFPPGPRGRLACSMRMAKDPVSALREWRTKYGDTFHLPLVVGDFVMTCDVDLARQVYGSRDPELFLAAAPASIEMLIGGRSLLRKTGDEHLRERKLMSPPFHGERMRSWAHTIAETGRKAFVTDVQPIRAIDRTRHATLEVILRVIFGIDDDARVARFQTLVEQWAGSLGPLMLFVPALQRELFGLSPYARYRRHSERLDAMLREQIAATRAREHQADDVLSMLVEARYDDGSALDEQSLIDNLRTLLFAGHDTTAITLAWAIDLVHRHPAVLDRLRAELDGLGDTVEPATFARLPYLSAVVDETLRFRPVASDTQRTLSRAWTLGEWRLPAHTTVCVSPLLIHFHEQHWERPHEFMPERFLGSRPSPMVFIPFGGGNHRCLGASFAHYEATIMLGTLLRELEFELLDEQARWGRGTLILEPLDGIRVRVHRRGLLRSAA